MNNKTNKTTMSIRDFVIIHNLVETELKSIKNMLWVQINSYYPSILNKKDLFEKNAEIDAKVEEQLKNDMRYQELLSIIQKLSSMLIEVNIPDIEIEDKTDNLTN